MTDNERRYYLIILGSVALILLGSLYLACTRGLTETLEAESAEIAREFLQGGSFLVNHLNGQEDLDKPPLFYWAIAICSLASPTWEVAARVPSIVSAVLVLFLFNRLGRSMNSRMLFATSALVFMTSPKVFWMSQVARIDMSLTAACFLAICSLYMFLEDAEKDTKAKAYTGVPVAFFISSAVAVMLKGPVGAIVVFTPVLIFLMMEKRWTLLRKIFAGRGMVLFLFLAVPWFVAASIETDYRFFHRFILEENLSRFTSLIPGGTFKEFNHSPLYTYPVYLMTGFFPWSLLVPFWFYDIVRNWHSKDPLSRLFFIYIVFILVFFSMAMSKRSDYILPLYPAAAFLTARYIMEARSGTPAMVPSAITMALVAAAGAVFSLTAFLVKFGKIQILLSLASDAKRPEILTSFLENAPSFIPVFLILFIAGISGLYFSAKNMKMRNSRGILASFALHVSVIFLVSGLVILPEIYRQKDARRFCKNVSQIVADSPLYYFGFWDEECSFYLKRRINRIFPRELTKRIKGKERIFLIVRPKDLKKLQDSNLSFPFEYKKDSPLLRPLILLSNKCS